jgi:hypothetical protein
MAIVQFSDIHSTIVGQVLKDLMPRLAPKQARNRPPQQEVFPQPFFNFSPDLQFDHPEAANAATERRLVNK